MAVVTAVAADPEWTVIADGIVVGRTPTSLEELEQLVSEADVKAVMCLQVRGIYPNFLTKRQELM